MTRHILWPALLAAALLSADAASAQPAGATLFEGVRLTGERITQGNAVDCPQIRDDSGKLHAVSYLSPAIEIGDRVTVSGVYGVSTRCVGTVLIVQTEAPSEN